MRYLTISLFILSIIFCQSSRAQEKKRGLIQPKLRLGLVLPLSGPLGPLGQEFLRGANVAMEHFQISQPQFATSVDWVKVDSKGRTAQFNEILEDLFERQRAHVLIGGLTGYETRALVAQLSPYQKPFISPVPAHMTGAYDESKMVFQSCLLDVAPGRAMARFVKKELKARRVALIQDSKTPYTKSILIQFKDEFIADGGQITAEQTYDPNKTSAELLFAALGEPEAIIFPGHPATALKLIRSARDKGISSPFIGSEDWATVKGFREASTPPLGQNYFLTPFHSSDPFEAVQDFEKLYYRKFGQSSTTMAAAGFDSVMRALNAFAEADSNRAAVLAKALRKGSCDQFEVKQNQSEEDIRTAIFMKTTDKGLLFESRTRL